MSSFPQQDVPDGIRAEAKWYNTLTSNCTTLVFDMIQAINPQTLPKDYRLLASGYLPNYLFDLKALNQNYSMKEWYQLAWINTRAEKYEQQPDQSSEYFSKIIRQFQLQNLHHLKLTTSKTKPTKMLLLRNSYLMFFWFIIRIFWIVKFCDHLNLTIH